MAYNAMSNAERATEQKSGQAVEIALSVVAAIVMLPLALIAMPFILASGRDDSSDV